MPDLRDMQLLAALARQAHFARAADESGISQSAFSERIRNLELDLGIPIVKRGNRFLGFTPEGEIVLRWARRMLADSEGLRQEVELARGALSGRLAIGVVPTALAYVARAPAQIRDRHPGLAVQVFSLTSAQIRQGLEDFSLDAAVTYAESGQPAAFQSQELYDERYALLAPPHLAPRRAGTATWREAAALPLSLLTQNMRNRRIIDDAFRSALGRSPDPALETNDFTAALVQVARGATATIAPELLLDSLPLASDAVRLRLVEPEVTTPVVLVLPDREPQPPAALAFAAALQQTP